MNSEQIRGLRVLVVEDNFLLAIELQAALTKLGCQVIGPVASVKDGMKIAETEALDGAILDINIVGGNSNAIAQVLARRSCPFFFITGYGSPAAIDPAMKEHKQLKKPVADNVLQAVLIEEFVAA